VRESAVADAPIAVVVPPDAPVDAPPRDAAVDAPAVRHGSPHPPHAAPADAPGSPPPTPADARSLFDQDPNHRLQLPAPGEK
jgi:hypothetical protein